MLTLCFFVFCLCLVCFESRRQPLRLGKAWDSLVLKQLRVFTGSLEEVFFFWLGAAWVKSRAEHPSVSEVN